MLTGEEILVCFESVTQAIMAEQALVERGFDVRVMPTPAAVRAGCGFCLRFLPEDFTAAAPFLTKQNFSGTEAYRREGASYTKIEM